MTPALHAPFGLGLTVPAEIVRQGVWILGGRLRPFMIHLLIADDSSINQRAGGAGARWGRDGRAARLSEAWSLGP